MLVLSGPQRHKLFAQIPAHDLVITSYALLRRDIEQHRAHTFDTAVLDEAQHIKNRSTQNAKAVKAIPAEHRLVLTGTPLENSVLDLWSLFDFLMPSYLGSSDDFRDRYEIPITKERDKGAMARLGKRIRPFLLRRLKKTCCKNCPPSSNTSPTANSRRLSPRCMPRSWRRPASKSTRPSRPTGWPRAAW